jgi:hypothetical protein
MKFDLDFRPASETPTQPGDYLLYNQCDGYHIAEAWFEDGEFQSFCIWPAHIVSSDFYCAWALLPDTIKTLYDLFAKKPETEGA